LAGDLLIPGLVLIDTYACAVPVSALCCASAGACAGTCVRADISACAVPVPVPYWCLRLYL